MNCVDIFKFMLGVEENVDLKICDQKKNNFNFEFMSNGDSVSGFIFLNLIFKNTKYF